MRHDSLGAMHRNRCALLEIAASWGKILSIKVGHIALELSLLKVREAGLRDTAQ